MTKSEFLARTLIDRDRDLATKDEALREIGYRDFVEVRLAAGDDPNKITSFIEDALGEIKDWALFGDGRWRRDTCCSVCGLWTAGLCGLECTEVAGRAVILRSEYAARAALKEPE